MSSFEIGAHQRDILQTSTAGDESAGNGRCESELGIIQAQTRVQLRAAGLEANWWPLALRHTVEQRQRDQLASMGITLPPLIPFGTECYAKLKRWHRRDWDHPFEKIRVLGPAMGMSTTSKGYYIQSLSSGKFMRSTVVVVPGTHTTTPSTAAGARGGRLCAVVPPRRRG